MLHSRELAEHVVAVDTVDFEDDLGNAIVTLTRGFVTNLAMDCKYGLYFLPKAGRVTNGGEEDIVQEPGCRLCAIVQQRLIVNEKIV